MESTDQSIEAEIQAKGLIKAPRVTPADIDAAIVSEVFFTGADGVHGAFSRQTYDGPSRLPMKTLARLTICVLTLRNGITVLGVNHGPVSAENFDSDMARKLARQKAVDQIWPLLGFELATRLAGTPS